MKRIGLVWRTVRHLTARQLVYQVLTRLRGSAKLQLPDVAPMSYSLNGPSPDRTIQTGPDADESVSWALGGFTFLNRSVHMVVVNWNYADHGKLWTYNLNYFDFLNPSGASALGLTPEDELLLVRDFIAQTDSLRAGLEPYPTSLRITNWVQFLSRNRIQDYTINRHLYAQSSRLRRRMEYHIAGNHLLENGFALLMAALYFRQETWFRRAAKLVRAELSTQILADGGHDERSPMYHQILLDRLLDVLLALRHDTWHEDAALVHFLNVEAARMLGWLDVITFRNGDVPMVNDAAWGIAPTAVQLKAKAKQLMLTAPESLWPTGTPGWCAGAGILTTANRAPWFVKIGTPTAQTTVRQQDTGYRKFALPRYELVADVGSLGPDHQPGHAHADTFSFVLYVDNQPLIVDSGTSTYEIGARRAWERSTAAHNTVDIMGVNSSEVWAGFRVGRRARTTVLTDTETTLTARHDGYRNLGVVHERTWSVEPKQLRITDHLTGTEKAITRNQIGVARLHFHPEVLVSPIGMSVKAGATYITFASVSAPELRLATYEMADGFNRLRVASCVEITFINYLETILIPTP